jgi:hypothetical protein
MHGSGASRREIANVCLKLPRHYERSEAIHGCNKRIDCFAEPVIGHAFARPSLGCLKSLKRRSNADAVIPGRAPAQTRNLEIPGSMRSLSSGRALRGPVGIAPE